MKNLFILSVLLIAFFSQIVPAQDNRGVKVKVRNQQGNTVERKIYDGSYALVIGAIDYKDASWVNLNGVRNDVKAVSETLRRQGFEVEQFINPTSVNLNSTIRSFVGRYGSRTNNRLLIYFAGHGYTETDESGIQRGYIVPVDAPSPKRKLHDFIAKATTMSDIESFARNIRSKHALFIFDSCFSGTLISRNAIRPPKYISYLTEKPVRQFITAGAANQTVPDESVFRLMFVKALDPNDPDNADQNNDGYVTGTELSLYLQEKVIYYQGKAQTPQYGKLRDPRFDQGDFVFALTKRQIKKKSASRSRTVSKPILKAGTVRKNSIGMELVWIPNGSFKIDSNNSEKQEALSNAKPYSRLEHFIKLEGPQKQIILKEGFWLGKYEVTQEQYKDVMGINPSYFKGCSQCPVEQISWEDTNEFIKKLNERNDGFEYSLPSEPEWEYAARGGTITPFGIGDGRNLSSKEANFDGNYPYGKASKENYLGKTSKVGSYQPNAWGVHDMHGNVWEWTKSFYQPNYDNLLVNGLTNISSSLNNNNRTLRGGSYANGGSFVRSAVRSSCPPTDKSRRYGFRIVARPSDL